MIKFLMNFLSPLSVFTALIFLSIVLVVVKRTGVAMNVLLVTVSAFLFIIISPISQWIAKGLESGITPFKSSLHSLENETTLIVVLGGGHTITPDFPPGIQLTNIAMVRLAEGIRIYHQLPGSKLLTSGNSTTARTTQAQMLADAAVALGVDPRDTLQNRLPYNTIEEVKYIKRRLEGYSKVIVVTSAWHMPRAMMICRKEGIIAIPSPTDFLMKQDTLTSNYDFYPSVMKLDMLEKAIHEYGGMLKTQFFYL